ncbi:hypothetical protein, partial [Enterobacter sp.]|uniref:hypothetical protein n=1 Tax=Enterobacter sp. TaxID=42895 RepID=UPI0039E321B5
WQPGVGCLSLNARLHVGKKKNGINGFQHGVFLFAHVQARIQRKATDSRLPFSVPWYQIETLRRFIHANIRLRKKAPLPHLVTSREPP